MILDGYLLRDDSRIVDLTHRAAPGRVHPLDPTEIIVHYDVCKSLDENDRAQLASGYHYHVGLDGNDRNGKPVTIRQYVPFNRQGSAAKGFNHRAINVVIVNPGPLLLGTDGRLRDVHGRLWDSDDAVEMRHKHPRTDARWKHWAAYHHEERDALIDICKLLEKKFPRIHTIKGHDVSDYGRKSDPGPAFYDSCAVYLVAAFPRLSVQFHPPRDYPEF